MDYNLRKRILNVSLGFFLVCVTLYLHFFASIRITVGVETTQIDKILHVIGGIFLASLIEWRISRLSFWKILGTVLLLFIFWKAFEFSVDSARYYQHISTHLNSWSFDFIGDGIATILGSILYWRMAIYKPPQDRLTKNTNRHSLSEINEPN